MFWRVDGSYKTYAVGAMMLPTGPTTPSCVTTRGGGGLVSTMTGVAFVSTTAAAEALVSIGAGAAFVGSVTMGCVSATEFVVGIGIGVGIGVVAGAVSVEGA